MMALSLVAIAASCISLGESHEDADKRFYGYFLEDQRAMEGKGFPVYWLGRAFTAGGMTFHGPYGAEFGGEVEGGGSLATYVSWLVGEPFEGSHTSLEITTYSPDAWELAGESLLNPSPQGIPRDYSVTRRTVSVVGRDADLISVPSWTRPVNGLVLIVELDPVVVVADAYSVHSADGSEENMFINNPDLLVQVIDENLRPYPE
jgi:hypothetical protein